MENNQTLRDLAYSVIIIFGFGTLLYQGAAIIIPFIFALLLAVFLYPIDKKILSFVKIKWLSIILSYLVLILPIVLIIGLFSMQLISIAESMPSISNSVNEGINKILDKVGQYIPSAPGNAKELAKQGDATAIEGPLKFLGQGLVSTSSIFASTGLCIIYSFFLLYYRRSFKNFIVYQFEKQNRPEIRATLKKIKETIQSYIGGLGIVIVILSVMNTIGLWVIGIEYAMFWGTMAGILAIIPFIGTMLGGLLPFLFALATADATWQPIAVVAYYLVIQQIEGNFITPNLVGDKVNINPLFAILSLVFFGTFWGIAGVILALPLISIVRIIMSNFESTESIAILMSADIDSKQGVFKKLSEDEEVEEKEEDIMDENQD